MSIRAYFIFLTGIALASVSLPAVATVKPPAVDPKRIVNESLGFLKEREPQMTENEYSIYEKVVPMAKESPELVLQMLEGMVGGAEPPSPAFSFVLGNVYYGLERYGPAEAHFRKAVERHPEFQRAWSNLGFLYYSTNRFDDAVRCLARAVELGDHEGNTLGTLAYCLYRVGNSLSAELVYLQAVTVEPNETGSISALASLLIENREYARAEPLARRLLRLKPQDKSHWSLYAGLLLSTERRTEARAILELASSLGLADREALLELGDLYAESGEDQAADAIYRKLEAAAGTGEGTARQLSQVRASVQGGKLAEAAAALEKIAVPTAGETRIGFLRTVAEVRRAQGNFAAERTAWEDLLRLRPLDGEALLALGRAAREAGDSSRAELAFSDAARQPGFAYAANLELANLALKVRHYKKSIEHLEAALAVERTPALLRHLAQIKAYLSDHE